MTIFLAVLWQDSTTFLFFNLPVACRCPFLPLCEETDWQGSNGWTNALAKG